MCVSNLYLFLLHLGRPRIIVHSQGSLVDDLPGKNSASPGIGLASCFHQQMLENYGKVNSKSNKFQDVFKSFQD